MMAMITLPQLVSLLLALGAASWEDSVDAQSPSHFTGRTRRIKQHVMRREPKDSIVVDHAARHYKGSRGHDGHPGKLHAIRSNGSTDDVSLEARHLEPQSFASEEANAWEAHPKHAESAVPGFIPRMRSVMFGDEEAETEADQGSHVTHEPDVIGDTVPDNSRRESSDNVYEDGDSLTQEGDKVFLNTNFWGRRRTRRRRAIPCTWTTWKGWSACPSCGAGRQQRYRHKNGPYHGGSGCAFADSHEAKPCFIKHCPVHCTYSAWGRWSGCSKTCGYGTNSKKRLRNGPFHGGRPCGGAAISTLACNTFSCPQDCYFEPWSAWGACTKTCKEGGTWGFKTRDRGKVGPFHGGKNCYGHTTDDALCNTFQCPYDCQVGVWGPWSTCTQSCSVSVVTHGYKIRARNSVPATNGGKVCAANWQMEHCNNFLCAFDCYFLVWGGWGPCSKTCTPEGGAGGMKLRNRGTVGPGAGGKACQGITELSQSCNQFMCPKDCVFSAWGPFGDCDKTCNHGLRSRTRQKVGAQFGGKQCVGPTQHMESCNAHACPIDCRWTAWNSWNQCTRSCGDHGTQQRGRAYDPSPANGGKMCPGFFMEMIKCNTFPCPVDCRWEAWLEWSLCSVSCGEGKRIRTRLEYISAHYGGADCSGEHHEEVACKHLECPMDCRFGEWGNWTACSSTCGTGNRSSAREMLYAEYGGSSNCPEGELTRSEECNEAPCAAEVKNGARFQLGHLAHCVLLLWGTFWQ